MLRRISRLVDVSLLSLLLAAAAAAVFVIWLPLTQRLPGPDLFLFGLFLAAAFYAAERFVVHLNVRHETHSFSLSEIPLVLGLFFASPLSLVAAQLAGAGAALYFDRHQPLRKLLFNLANFAFSTTVAIVVFRAIVAHVDPLGPFGWAAAFVAAFVADVLQGMGVSLAIGLSQRSVPSLPEVLGVGSIYTLADTTLGIIAVLVLWHEPLAAPLLAALAFVTYSGYRAYQDEARKNSAVEVLQESTRGVQRITGMADLRSALLEGARRVFGASRAELLLFPADGQPAIQSQLAGGSGVETRELEQFDLTYGSWSTVVATGRGATLRAAREPERVRQYLAGEGITNALVAPIHREERIIGVLQVANREAQIGDWKADDVTLFETLANQASVSIANAELVDQLRAAAAEQHRLAVTDTLTSLANRLQLRYWLSESVAVGGPFGVLLLDIDRFKHINDTLGHDTGDLVLVEVGRRLSAVLEEGARLAHVGGDEFVLVVPLANGRQSLADAAARVRDALQRPVELSGLGLMVQASIGASLFPDHGTDPEVLVRRAEVAMYLAKETKTGLEVYDAGSDPYDEMTLSLSSDLQRAIESGELTLAFQPQIGLATGRVDSAEALVRWRHPRRGPIAPDAFIPIAETTGLIKPLTRTVLRQAVGECRRWMDLGFDLAVAINLSTRNLHEPDLADFVGRLLSEFGVPPPRVTLEITESAVMANDPRVAAVIDSLASLGVDLSVDDFGTGYSSLSYLRRLPACEIKIDQSFVHHMLVDQQDAAIVEWTIALCRTLGRRTVAEGVEDARVLQRLGQLGCDRAQGYHLGRPMSGPDMLEYLRTRTVPALARQSRRARPAAASPGGQGTDPGRPAAERPTFAA